jgi:hypothetical protein
MPGQVPHRAHNGVFFTGEDSMPNFKLPLSGDVMQTINPWNWFFRSDGGQFGFVNINLGKSADPELERTRSWTRSAATGASSGASARCWKCCSTT